jgi:hypothetical protein
MDDVSFATCIQDADWSGSYLYMKWLIHGHPLLRIFARVV